LRNEKFVVKRARNSHGRRAKTQNETAAELDALFRSIDKAIKRTIVSMEPREGENEFKEIAHCGGKITFIFSPPESVSCRIVHSGRKGKAAMFQLGISLDGQRLQYWPLVGMDTRPPAPPSPMVPAFIFSDSDGFFGRSCPACKSYFRTTRPAEKLVCPYCGHRDWNVAFTTGNQLAFVNKFRESFVSAFKNKQSIEIDLDCFMDELPANKPGWMYAEQKQQNTFACPNCKTGYDILGEYGCCPACGKRNSLSVFERELRSAERLFQKADNELKNQADRGLEWERILTRCVSDFEAMARDIQAQLLLFPATVRRKNDIRGISFQNILKAHDSITNWCGFELLPRFSDDDRKFLNRMFNRRHLLTHNAGRVDQEYLDNTGDRGVRLNQKIRVGSNEIKRLFPLLRKIAENFFNGFESIK
jgi:hypothetical protein